jgi:acetyl-CoA synthetase
MRAITLAAQVGAAQARVAQTLPIAGAAHFSTAAGTPRMLNELASKQALAAYGLPVPASQCVPLHDVAAAAHGIGFPLVVKAVSDTLAHKTEAGGVVLNVQSADAALAAAKSMAALSDRFLVEAMATGAVAEIIVGVQRDAQFGLTLTVGAGGVLVELLQDAVTLLLPISPADVRSALQQLKTWPLLNGFRGKAHGDVDALVAGVCAIADYAQANATNLQELDVNPLLVLPQGQGVLAVDALIYVTGQSSP